MNLDLPKKESHKIEAIAIGSSLGGPAAISFILQHLSTPFPVPIFIVQHISSGFASGLVEWLNHTSVLPVVLAKQGDLAVAGSVYVAPDDRHMEIRNGGYITLTSKGNSTICPSIGNLFRSLSETYGKHCVGVILTGMGKDGAEELLLMRQKGAITIAQDEKSSVMFGMAKIAIELDAVDKILSLEQIPKALERLVRGL